MARRSWDASRCVRSLRSSLPVSLDAVHEYARDVRYTTLYLDSKDDLTDAIRFYAKRGYRPCPRYSDNPQATVFMKLAL